MQGKVLVLPHISGTTRSESRLERGPSAAAGVSPGPAKGGLAEMRFWFFNNGTREEAPNPIAAAEPEW